MDFSVLMATYAKDDSLLLAKALQSIVEQTVQCSELVLVEDGPLTEKLYSTIDSYRHRIDINSVRLEKNYGLATALNRGLLKVKNNIVFRADSDDINRPYRFEKQLQKFKDGYELVGGLIRELDDEGRQVGFRIVPQSKSDIIKFAKNRNPFNHMSVAFLKDTVLSIGGYPNIYLKEDYALWASLLARDVNAVNIGEILVDVSAGKNMYKRRGGRGYIRSEYEMQLHLINCGLETKFQAVIYGVSRIFVFLLPSRIRGYIYEKYLRNSDEELTY